MARNPKDLVVSYYQFHRSLRTMSYRGTFQEFCRRFMNDKRKCQPGHHLGTLTVHAALARAGAPPAPPRPGHRCAHGACFPADG